MVYFPYGIQRDISPQLQGDGVLGHLNGYLMNQWKTPFVAIIVSNFTRDVH
jgi:hypothetical protein